MAQQLDVFPLSVRTSVPPHGEGKNLLLQVVFWLHMSPVACAPPPPRINKYFT